jgi:hypothetical protein
MQREPNTLGNASLGLGIAAATLVFAIGLCALVGAQQGWLQAAGTPIFVCGATSVFLGVIARFLGLAGLLGRNRSRATAIVGITLGAFALCLFLFAVSRLPH